MKKNTFKDQEENVNSTKLLKNFHIEITIGEENEHN